MEEQVTIVIDKKDLNILAMAVNRFWAMTYKESIEDKTDLGKNTPSMLWKELNCWRNN